MKFVILIILLSVQVLSKSSSETFSPISAQKKNSESAVKNRRLSSKRSHIPPARARKLLLSVLATPIHMMAEGVSFPLAAVGSGALSYLFNKSDQRMSKQTKMHGINIRRQIRMLDTLKRQRHNALDKLKQVVEDAETQLRESEHDLNEQLMTITIPLQHYITEKPNGRLII